jgi:hypothetical protein
MKMYADLMAELHEIGDRPNHAQHIAQDSMESGEVVAYYCDLMRTHERLVASDSLSPYL